MGGPNVERVGGSRMGTINIVRVHLSGFNGPSCGASPAEGRRCSTEGLLKVERRGFRRLGGLGFRVQVFRVQVYSVQVFRV